MYDFLHIYLLMDKKIYMYMYVGNKNTINRFGLIIMTQKRFDQTKVS